MPVVSLQPDNVLALPYLGQGETNHQCIYWDAALASFGVVCIRVAVVPSSARIAFIDGSASMSSDAWRA
jgi:hypothetical protein